MNTRLYEDLKDFSVEQKSTISEFISNDIVIMEICKENYERLVMKGDIDTNFFNNKIKERIIEIINEIRINLTIENFDGEY